MKREQEGPYLQDQSSSKDFVLGAIVGGIVGAATALFLAPKSGKDLMKDINGHAHTLKDKGVELSGTVKEKGTEFISIAKDKSGQFGQTVTKTSADLKDKVKGKVKNINLNSQEVDNGEEEPEHINLSLNNTGYDEIQQKLEETKRAFDETESKYNS